MLLGLDLSFHPFSACPTYRRDLASLSLKDRLIEMRRPEVKARLLAETPEKGTPETAWSRKVESMYELGDPPDYSPPPSSRLTERALRMNVPALELAYELLTQGDGNTLLFFPITNFAHGTLDNALTMLRHPNTIVGANDAGAHIGFICDGSYPTHMLTYWTRDRKGERLGLADAVRMLSRDTAHAIGLDDRGVVAIGYRADLNVIDYDKLKLHAPRIANDFPAAGRRLKQGADGFVATIVNGVVTRRDDASTGRFPGRLIRGAQQVPKEASPLPL
jgi:N-acyl-D-aspartate/D-glutamate deacylase